MAAPEPEPQPPLEKRVLRKPDGRYLILYSRPWPHPDPPKEQPQRKT